MSATEVGAGLTQGRIANVPFLGRYRTFPGWIKLILIRKATDIAEIGLEEKNEPVRFERAFKGIPRTAWHVFEDPSECVPIVNNCINEA